MKRVLLIDFDDSFTQNINQSLCLIGKEVTVVHYTGVTTELIKKFDLCLLGPGPGNIFEYEEIFEVIKENPNTRFFGVCLGFQILCFLSGFDLVKLDIPRHGESLPLPSFASFMKLKDFKGQFYNSWYIHPENTKLDKVTVDFNMVTSFSHGNFSGVQFHPESIGTDNYPTLLNDILERMY